MDMPFTDEQMHEFGYVNWRIFDDGTIWAVSPMSFGNGRLVIDIDSCGYADFYCYDGLAAAVESMWSFNPDLHDEPTGWKRHGKTGRRRPDGDPAGEYINM